MGLLQPALSPSRRAVLKGAATLTFVVAGAGLVPAMDAVAQDALLGPNPWVEIRADGAISIVFPSTEMGQGSSTALPLILAEELDADWDDVVIEQLDRDDRTYGNPLFGNILYTAGSTAVPGYFEPLRRAGAQARALLVLIAARHLAVAPETLRTEPSTVIAQDGTRLSYGELAALGAEGLMVPPPDSVTLKTPDAFRLIGKDVPRRDIPAKSSGREVYAIDVAVPDMAFASVLRAPVEGETVVSVDDSAARAVSGVIDIVALPDGLAVVAESLSAAMKGRSALTVTWSETSPARTFDSDAALRRYAEAAAADEPAEEVSIWREDGDVAAALSRAAVKVRAEYLSDYAYHAQMEPMAAVARVDADGLGAEVWAGTQTQTWTTRTVTEVLGTTPDRVKLHMMTMGGSFGRRTALRQEYVRDALLAAKATGRPVKVVWTREDDLKHGWFRPAAAQRMTAGLSAEGALSGWTHRVATPSVIGYFNPLRWEQVAPRDIISMRGAESQFYTIDDFRADHVITERQAHLAPYRAIGASYTSFAAEAFMDEVAEAAGHDPLDFRIALLGENPRGRALLSQVAEMAGWADRGEERALGLSFAGYGNSMAAGIAEVVVDRASGAIRVPRFWAAIDAGLIVSPDNARAQIEGGIVFGLSSALKERVTIKQGVVEQSNFFNYPILRSNEIPAIEIHVARVDAPPTGIGEVGTPMTSAAVANAFHAATGRRLRHMPFTPERVLAALS